MERLPHYRQARCAIEMVTGRKQQKNAGTGGEGEDTGPGTARNIKDSRKNGGETKEFPEAPPKSRQPLPVVAARKR